MKNIKVTIITVCYNSAATIEDTIKSVVNQTYPNIEYIILDGKSTDNTIEIVEKFRGRISKVSSEKDSGMYDAINKGIAKASGDIIGILNSDDFYSDKNVISDVVEMMAASNSDALYADLHYVGEQNTNEIKRYWKSGEYKEGMFLKGWMPPHPTFFVRKKVYEDYGVFNLEMISASDYELMLRFIHKFKIKIAYLPRVIVKMRVGGLSNVSLKNRLRANREDKKAWQMNNLHPNAFTLLFKPLRKLIQFAKKQ